jgi:hypothetical protein
LTPDYSIDGAGNLAWFGADDGLIEAMPGDVGDDKLVFEEYFSGKDQSWGENRHALRK